MYFLNQYPGRNLCRFKRKRSIRSFPCHCHEHRSARRWQKFASPICWFARRIVTARYCRAQKVTLGSSRRLAPTLRSARAIETSVYPFGEAILSATTVELLYFRGFVEILQKLSERNGDWQLCHGGIVWQDGCEMRCMWNTGVENNALYGKIRAQSGVEWLTRQRQRTSLPGWKSRCL